MLGSDDNDRTIRVVRRIVVMSFDDNIYVHDMSTYGALMLNMPTRVQYMA